MEKVINLYKQVGETPLECLERFRVHHPEYQNIKMTYAGRLDPLAEGVLIVLAGDAVHERAAYLELPKTYTIKVLIGVATDSYDLLGMPTLAAEGVAEKSDLHRLRNLIEVWPLVREQHYPPFSSKTVDGVQLHTLAREGKIDEIEIPTRNVSITSAVIDDVSFISSAALSKLVQERIALVHGDFRQQEILKAWSEAFASRIPERFPVITVTVVCGSGTYMRTLAHELGKSIGNGAIALEIRRTRVGDFAIRDSL